MMNKITVSHIFFGLFLVVTLYFAITSYQFVSDHLPEFLSVFIFWLLAFFKMLYDSSAKVYLFVNRLIAWITNSTSNWEFAIQFDISEDRESAIQHAVDSIFQVFPKAKVWQDDNNQKIIHAPGFTVRIKAFSDISQDTDELHSNSLYIDITEMVVSYRYTVNTLSNKIAPLLEKLSRNIDTEWGKYVLKIKYDGVSPFFGLYIKKLRPQQVTTFKCELFEIVGNEKDNVTIGKNETTIITTSVTSLLALSRKYLSITTSSSS